MFQYVAIIIFQKRARQICTQHLNQIFQHQMIFFQESTGDHIRSCFHKMMHLLLLFYLSLPCKSENCLISIKNSFHLQPVYISNSNILMSVVGIVGSVLYSQLLGPGINSCFKLSHWVQFVIIFNHTSLLRTALITIKYIHVADDFS